MLQVFLLVSDGHHYRLKDVGVPESVRNNFTLNVDKFMVWVFLCFVEHLKEEKSMKLPRPWVCSSHLGLESIWNLGIYTIKCRGQTIFFPMRMITRFSTVYLKNPSFLSI